MRSKRSGEGKGKHNRRRVGIGGRMWRTKDGLGRASTCWWLSRRGVGRKFGMLEAMDGNAIGFGANLEGEIIGRTF